MKVFKVMAMSFKNDKIHFGDTVWGGFLLGGFYTDYIARVLIIRTTIYTESREWENSIFQEKDKTVAL